MRFSVGDQVKLISTSTNPLMEGAVGIVTNVFQDKGQYAVLFPGHAGPNGSEIWAVYSHQLWINLNKVVSWNDCVWKPEGVK